MNNSKGHAYKRKEKKIVNVTIILIYEYILGVKCIFKGFKFYQICV